MRFKSRAATRKHTKVDKNVLRGQTYIWGKIY